MLAEAFLNRLAYKDIMSTEKQKNRANNNIHKDAVPWRDKLQNTNDDALDTETLKVLNETKDGHSARSTDIIGGSIGQASEAMHIPKRSQNDKHLDLYTSWSTMYGSMYKNYPDLHIAGDHILNKKDSGCVLDLDCEYPDGPVLLSIDIASGTTPPAPDLEQPTAIGVVLGEENREKSCTFPNVPFSTSALNGYIESKIQELYKQFLAENMTRFGSPSSILTSSILMNNVHQISMQISQEQNVEHGKTREAILNYLRSMTSGGSSEFITPVLHISNIEHKTKSEQDILCL
ncbi:TLR adapter interacting with SLC15A4 on the lysosome-like isoform 1-T3 [Discoglossus pictus]